MGENLGPGLFGCIIGFFLAGVVGRVLGYILWHWGRVTAIRNPEIISHATDRTPWQVLVDGCRSLLLLLSIFILVVIVLLLAAYSFGWWEEVIAFIMSVVQFMIRPLI
jgi:hypothetical protein